MAPPEFPPALESDSENVVWLLSTGSALWQKGERTEAVRWLSRAGDGALDDGDVARAEELAEFGKTLERAAAEAPPPPPPVSRRSSPGAKKPLLSQTLPADFTTVDVVAMERAIAEKEAKARAAAAPGSKPQIRMPPGSSGSSGTPPTPGLPPPRGAAVVPPRADGATTPKPPPVAPKPAAPKPGPKKRDSKAPPPVFDEEELSSRDVVTAMMVIEPVPTRRFSYPDGLEAGATRSAEIPARPVADRPTAPSLPANVLPAIRVWIVGGKVIPAEGPRPAGAADGVLVAAVPGVDLAALLLKPA